MRTNRNIADRWVHGLGIALALAMACPAFASDARDRGRCVTVDLPAAVVLPDGTRHEDARRMKLCVQERLSPTASLHEIRLDGHPIGLFRSESGRSEDRAELTGAVVVFERNRAREDGDVTVWGYAVQEGERLRIFRMEWHARAPGM